MEYKVVDGCDPVFLSIAVEQHIAAGWRPLGSPFLYGGGVSQAMTREKEQPPTKMSSEQLDRIVEMLLEFKRHPHL